MAVTSIEIGNRKYDLPEMNFAAVERAWPWVEQATVLLDPIKGTGAGLRIIAACLIEDENFDRAAYGMNKPEDMTLAMDEVFEHVTYHFKKKLKANQIEQVRDAVMAILKDADLLQEADDNPSGEAEAGATRLPEIAPASSPSLLPQDVPGETGTA